MCLNGVAEKCESIPPPFFEMKCWWWWRGDVAGVCTRRRFKRRDDRVRVVEPTPKILSPGPGRAHLFFPLTSYLILRMTILFYFIYFSFSDVTWKSNCRPGWSKTLIAIRLATVRAGPINRSAISHVAHTHLSPAVTDLNEPSTLLLYLLADEIKRQPGRAQKININKEHRTGLSPTSSPT